MSIISAIQKVSDNIAAAYTALGEKGATLPEVQDSSNLAETIASVPSGGGGGSEVIRGTWVVPAPFLALDAEVTAIGEDSDSNTCVIGVHFNKLLLDNDEFCITDAFYTKVIYPELTFSDDGQYYKKAVLPQDCDTIIIKIENFTGVDITNLFTSLGNSSDSLTLTRTVYATDYITVYIKNSSYYFTFDPGNRYVHECHALTSGVRYSWSYFPSLSTMSYLPSVTEVEYQGFWTVTTPFKEFVMLPNLPYGMDFSSKTDAWDFSVDVTTANGNNLYRRPRLEQMYVILPNANVTMNGSPSNWSKYGILLTADNWSYIAEHAPTVSGKTLTINQINMDELGATNKATLESKGWTVSLIS